MELQQIRCFIAVAEELHFGHAAQKLDMLPSALGRYIKLLEEDLGLRLLTRSTRNVSLTQHGELFLAEAIEIIHQADDLQQRFQKMARRNAGQLRIGAIDSAAVNLVPQILTIFRNRFPDIVLHVMEDKTSRLLPKLKTGRLDLVFIRPGGQLDPSLEQQILFYESAVLVVSDEHPLASRDVIHLEDLADVTLIVPERRVRPHSYDLTVSLFENSGIKPHLIQIADEKQTIINMVASQIGAAIMPRWISRMSALNVRFINLAPELGDACKKLPIAAAWIRETRDEARDTLMNIVIQELDVIAGQY
ncbi:MULTISPECIES: LysR substrate-binding domain-containing protein [Klebsiella]|uniref:LysR family transcriptional regulator n=1 Tax=Klebsiella variicola TaxID=244366 RepID=A0ABD7PDA6_KLEVA|nr:LysR substrate-binding domain-containing protein [Klebsiella variicola]MCD9672801.1 LysR substrate-binding domain-containing protein [Klebsiella variicola subsp. variicola]MCK6050135.1 LysR family transcriptional regulator [Klebsiella variicola]PXL43362.1 LysR family transcriptional regulator [Klebsiella variicola]SXF98522.1 LysR family transcriptional regulator [Klebsiella variicola]